MKIKNFTVRPFLQNEITVRIPASWHDLTDSEAWTVFSLMEKLPPETLPVNLFVAINRIKVLARSGSGNFLCSMPGVRMFEISGATLASVAAPLRFALTPPQKPWRPAKFGKLIPVDADMTGLIFRDWLVIENTLQGVIHTGDRSILDNLIPVLMRNGKSRHSQKLSDSQRSALLCWILSVRGFLSLKYTHFMTPATENGNLRITEALIRESTDSQIRALTGGDITKEEQVLNHNLYRAIAELDAKAREYEQYKSHTK